MPELSLKPLRQIMELAVAAAILRKENVPSKCRALLARIEALPVKSVSLRGPYEPMQKSITLADTGLPAKLWGGANTAVDLQDARFRSDRSLSSLLSRIQTLTWSGSAASLKGAFEPVIADAESVSRIELAEPHIQSAVQHLKSRKFTAAIEELDRARALNPESAKIYFLRCMAWLSTDNPRALYVDGQSAVRLAPNDPAAYYWRGLGHSENRRPSEALADAEKAVKMKPDSVDFLLLQGAMKRDLGRYRDAIADFDKAAKMAPRKSFVLFQRGLTRAESGDRKGAIVDLSAAIALSPQSTQNLELRANVYERDRQYSLAVADLARIVEISPSSSGFTDLATAKLQAGDYNGSVEDSTTALLLDARNPFAHMNRAMALQELKLYSRAIDDYGAAIPRLPNLADVLQKRIDKCRQLMQNQ